MPWRMFVVGKSVVDPSTGETSATSSEHDSLYGARTSACVHILSGYTPVRTEAPDGKVEMTKEHIADWRRNHRDP
jgi:hypothetical protein